MPLKLRFMNKRLKDLAKQEWDTLFPIELVDYDPNWKNKFERERKKIIKMVGDKIVIIEHVGSTSIPNIKAKPYIDISIEILKEDLFNEEIIGAMQNLNYHFFRQTGTKVDYMIFVKGYNLNGEKNQIFHIHMCPPDHEMLNQIAFRDYLNANPKRALEYEQLKLELALTFKNDRSGYRIAKGDFIRNTMNMAKEAATNKEINHDKKNHV